MTENIFMMPYETKLVSKLIFSSVATWSYNDCCFSEQRGKHCSDLLDLLNNGAYISLHVVGLTSHASFFMQLQMFLPGFTFGDCRGNGILYLFEPCLHRHGSVARNIVLLEHKRVLFVPKHLLYWLQQISTHEVNVRKLVYISINHYQIATAKKLMHPQSIAIKVST